MVTQLIVSLSSLLFPVVGITLTAMLSSWAKNRFVRFLILLIGPILSLVLFGMVLKYGGASSAGMLLSLSIYGIFLVGLFIYYPILLIYYLVSFLKNRQ